MIDKHASFGVNVRDGKLYVHCLAGCSQDQVIDELKRRGLWGKTNGAGSSYAAMRRTRRIPTRRKIR